MVDGAARRRLLAAAGRHQREPVQRAVEGLPFRCTWSRLASPRRPDDPARPGWKNLALLMEPLEETLAGLSSHGGIGAQLALQLVMGALLIGGLK